MTGYKWAARAAVAALAAGGVVSAVAAPVAVSNPPPLTNGFQIDWVQIDANVKNVHTLTDAQNVLAGTGGFSIINTATTFANTLNLVEASPFDSPSNTDPRFVVHVTGYLQLAAGSYQFASFHDDGVSVVLGGENIINFPTDTSPTTTFSAAYALTGGVYAFDLIGWEQGGQFDMNFTQSLAAATNGQFVLSQGFHATSNVPEPGSFALAGLAMLGLAAARRRRG